MFERGAHVPWLLAIALAGCGSASGLEVTPGDASATPRGNGTSGSNVIPVVVPRDSAVPNPVDVFQGAAGHGGTTGIIDAARLIDASTFDADATVFDARLDTRPDAPPDAGPVRDGGCDGDSDACAIDRTILTFGGLSVGATAEVHALAVSADGTAYIAGWFSGSVNFGDGNLIAVGPDHDAFVAKFDPRGSILWSKRYGDQLEEDISSAALDVAGGLVVTGSFSDSLDFGGGPMTSAGGDDAYIAHLDGQGRYVDSERFGNGPNQYGQSVAVTGTNEIVVVGSFAGDLSPFSSTATAGGLDAYVLEFSPGGQSRGSKTYGDAMDQWGMSVAVDSDGSTVFAGIFRGTINFGLGDLTSAGEEDIFVARFDPTGTISFSKRFGGTGYDEAWGVAVDGATHRIALTGRANGQVDFGCGTVSAGGDDAFVTLLESDGQCSYGTTFGDPQGFDIGRAVAFTPAHEVVAVGTFSGDLGLGSPAALARSDDVFVVRFDASGQAASIRVLGGEGSQSASAVATDALGNVYVAGSFRAGLDYGTKHVPTRGAMDAFLARLPP